MKGESNISTLQYSTLFPCNHAVLLDHNHLTPTLAKKKINKNM